MKAAITDASVFFDLFHVGVLPEFFGLDLEIYTTDFIFNEIIRSEEREQFEVFVRSNQLKIMVIDESEQEIIKNMSLIFSINSISDRTALYKAKQMGCILLTCDEKLKKEAIRQNLEVHGSIWIIDEIISMEMLTKIRAIEVLELLKTTNAWLPISEIDTRINNLRMY